MYIYIYSYSTSFAKVCQSVYNENASDKTWIQVERVKISMLEEKSHQNIILFFWKSENKKKRNQTISTEEFSTLERSTDLWELRVKKI